jgi:hypothetical protein
MDSDTVGFIIVMLAILGAIFLFHDWQDKKNAILERESEEAHAKKRRTLDYFLSERAKFRERMRRYRGVPDVPRAMDAYVVLYLDGQTLQRLAKLDENNPMAIRLRLSFLDYLEKLRDDLGWIGFEMTEDEAAASRKASGEFQNAKDMILTLLGDECRAVTRTAESQRYEYFNEDGTFRVENTLNLPPVIPP